MTVPATLPRGKSNGRAPAPPAETIYATSELASIPVGQVDVGPNVRTQPGELDELIASIQEHGILQPIKVRQVGDRWQVVWGQRRYLAAVAAGLERIPALIDVDVDKPAAKLASEQLVENLQRADLNPIDEANALRAILDADAGLTQVELATRLGRSAPWVSNALRLLNLDAKVQAQVVAGEISQSHAKAIASLPAKQQREVARAVVDRKMSARDLERTLEWKRSEAETEEAAAKRTEKMIPKVLGALAAIEAPKGATVFLSAYAYQFDIERLRAAVRKAGFKPSSEHVFAAPEKGCKCTGTYRLEVSGRSAKAERACTSDHWRREDDRRRNAERQESAAERKAHLAKLAAVTEAIASRLDAVPDPVLRLVILFAGEYGWPKPSWVELAELDSAALRQRFSAMASEEWRMRGIDPDALIAELNGEQVTVDDLYALEALGVSRELQEAVARGEAEEDDPAYQLVDEPAEASG